jgi:hypothetical protein
MNSLKMALLRRIVVAAEYFLYYYSYIICYVDGNKRILANVIFHLRSYPSIRHQNH